ncbi:hypothetical protein D0Y65_029766 [Glycine soja]|uniref:Uncharacterized protein n=1 Tax=Glycine soja TaxID=3848 RepID=A0A445I0Q9_GLYSO|nr:hypothetical protein D0Y65_029766 [Glycine soja]
MGSQTQNINFSQGIAREQSQKDSINGFCDEINEESGLRRMLTLIEHSHGTWSLRGREFWYARQAFLNSYHFNLERNNDSFKEKLKKSVKEVNEAAMRIVLGTSHVQEKAWNQGL